MVADTVRNANNRWHGILTGFGMGVEELSGKHCPCPMCDGKDRFRFDNKDGRGTYYCSQCGPGDGMALVMKFTGQSFSDCATKIDRMIGTITTDKPQHQSADPRRRIYKVSHECLPAKDSINPVRLYLQSRGFINTQIPSFPDCIRYHPKLSYFEDGKYAGSYPAMVLPIRDVSGAGVSLHITYLTAGGEKAPVSAPKKILPPRLPMMGSAIRLTPVSQMLGVAEGIETALAVTAQFGIPCWATANSGMMEKLELPPEVKTVRIFGDNDISYTGHKAAYTLAARMVGQGRDADVCFPQIQGSDFADRLAAAK